MKDFRSKWFIVCLIALATPGSVSFGSDDPGRDAESVYESNDKPASESLTNALIARLSASRAQLKQCEESFGVDDWRCKSLRLTVQENKRMSELTRTQLGQLLDIKARIESETKNGVTFKCADTLAIAPTSEGLDR